MLQQNESLFSAVALIFNCECMCFLYSLTLWFGKQRKGVPQTRLRDKQKGARIVIAGKSLWRLSGVLRTELSVLYADEILWPNAFISLERFLFVPVMILLSMKISCLFYVVLSLYTLNGAFKVLFCISYSWFRCLLLFAVFIYFIIHAISVSLHLIIPRPKLLMR